MLIWYAWAILRCLKGEGGKLSWRGGGVFLPMWQTMKTSGRIKLLTHAWQVSDFGSYFNTSFPCRYRQKAGFVGPCELATLTRRLEPASPATLTRRLMKRPTIQHGGARKERFRYAWQSKDNQSQWCLYFIINHYFPSLCVCAISNEGLIHPVLHIPESPYHIEINSPALCHSHLCPVSGWFT